MAIAIFPAVLSRNVGEGKPPATLRILIDATELDDKFTPAGGTVDRKLFNPKEKMLQFLGDDITFSFV